MYFHRVIPEPEIEVRSKIITSEVKERSNNDTNLDSNTKTDRINTKSGGVIQKLVGIMQNLAMIMQRIKKQV